MVAVRHSAKNFLIFFKIFCLFSLPSALSLALGKDPLCRVPGLALGKEFFFYFCSQIFSLGLLQCFKVHVKIWLNFVTFYYIFRIIFVLLIYFAKSKFELQVHRIMKSNHSKNDCHASECVLRPYPGTCGIFFTSCERNMRTKLRPKCF